MKKYKYLFLLMFLFTMTSCLKGNLEDLPAFEENAIRDVQRVEYRYISSDVSGASGQQIVKYVTLTQSATVDKNNNSVNIKVTVPAVGAAFPQAERDKCSKSNIAVMISISTAARVTPVGDAPLLGIPGDWSKPNKYTVTAANGDKKEWTITVTDFTK